MNGKASTVLNPGSFVEIFLGLWLLNFETCNFLLKRSRLFFSVKAFYVFYDKKIAYSYGNSKLDTKRLSSCSIPHSFAVLTHEISS